MYSTMQCILLVRGLENNNLLIYSCMCLASLTIVYRMNVSCAILT